MKRLGVGSEMKRALPNSQRVRPGSLEKRNDLFFVSFETLQNFGLQPQHFFLKRCGCPWRLFKDGDGSPGFPGPVNRFRPAGPRGGKA